MNAVYIVMTEDRRIQKVFRSKNDATFGQTTTLLRTPKRYENVGAVVA